MATRIRIYQLFPNYSGGFSTQSKLYTSGFHHVAASSAEQAIALARKGIRATSAEEPVGIVEIYRKNAGAPGDHELWCGCRIFGGLFAHSQSKTTIRNQMAQHLAERHSSPQA